MEMRGGIYPPRRDVAPRDESVVGRASEEPKPHTHNSHRRDKTTTRVGTEHVGVCRTAVTLAHVDRRAVGWPEFE